jgi:hypothetical protein
MKAASPTHTTWSVGGNHWSSHHQFHHLFQKARTFLFQLSSWELAVLRVCDSTLYLNLNQQSRHGRKSCAYPNWISFQSLPAKIIGCQIVNFKLNQANT